MQLNFITTITYSLVFYCLAYQKTVLADDSCLDYTRYRAPDTCENEWDHMLNQNGLFSSAKLTETAPKSSEWRISKRGNKYKAVIPNDELAKLIDACPIEFSTSISQEKYAEYTLMIKQALPQRINHEILSNTLVLKDFSILVSETGEEVGIDFEYYAGFGGIFDYPSRTLILHPKVFSDEAWSLHNTIANELSHASIYSIPGAAMDNILPAFSAIQVIADTFKEEIQALEGKIRFLIKAIETRSVNTATLQAQVDALYNFHPAQQRYLMTQDVFNNRFKVIQSDAKQYNSIIQPYKMKNREDIYVIKDTVKCDEQTDQCTFVFFRYNPLLNNLSNKMTSFYNQVTNYLDRVYSEHGDHVYIHQRKSKQALELMTFFDSMQQELKEAFFPGTCQRMTEEYSSVRSYCQY